MGLLRETMRRAGYLIRRASFDRDLDEEARFHVETRAEELEQSGLARAEALAQAEREFGSAIRMREDTRSAWQFRWLEDLCADLRYAARALRRSPAFALTATTCLALGIGANTTIFSLSTELLFSEPSCRDSQSLVKIWIGGSSASPMPEYRFIRDAGIFDGLAGENEETEVNWRQGDNSDRLFTVRVTDNFFSVLGIPVAMGRPIEPGESDTVVLTHGFWRRRMGRNPDIIGRVMILDGRPYVVAGILPADHRTVTGFGFSPDLYLPVSPVSDDRAIVTFYARLPGGMTRQIAHDRLVAACQELDRVYPHGDPRWASAVKVSAISGMDRLKADELMPIAAFFGLLIVVVGLVLLIACANVAGLLLARASGRSQELAIRLSIGAGRGRIIRQLLAESLLLALCGTVAGLALNLMFTSLLNHIRLPLPIPLQLLIRPDWRLITYSIGVVLLCTIATGLMPALKGTRPGISAALKQDARQVGGRSRWTLRDALVVGQLAVSVVLLCTGFIFMRNLLRASTMTPGFDIEHTIWAYMRLVPGAYSMPEKAGALVQAALEQMRALPGVEAAAVTRNVPLNRHSTTGTEVRPDTSPDPMFVMFNDNYVGPDYFKSMKIPIVQGREFVASDRPGSPPVAILNENMAERMFGPVNPLGHSIRFGDGPPITIAGVARNSKYFTLGEENALAYYGPYSQLRPPETDLHFMIRAAGDPDGLVPAINRVLGQLDSTAAIETRPMRNALSLALLPSRVGAAIVGSTGLLGLALAALGLYGVLVYAVSTRVREIGLRVALGASPGNIVGLVLRQSLALVALGTGIGISLAVLAVRPLAEFLTPDVRPTDSTNFVVVAAVLGCVAIVATVSPSLRALRVDPGVALRHE